MTSLKLNIDHKEKHSNYLITVNTQQAGDTEERKEELIEALRTTLKDIFTYDNISELLDFLIIGDTWFENVDETEVDFAIEEGKKLHRIHAHCLVRVKHNSTIHLNYVNLRKQIIEGLRSELGDDTIVPHIKIKPFGGRNPDKDAEDYIMKDVRGGTTILHASS